MANTQLILWDWNGTLLDDRAESLACLNQLLEEYGYPQRFTLEEYRAVFGFPIVDYYTQVGFDFTRHSFDELAKRYVQLYGAMETRCPPVGGAREVLAALQRAGYRQVVLSASPIDTLKAQVAARDLGGYFEALLGLGDIYAASKVALGQRFMEQCGIAPERAVMVGDTLHDAEVAAALGARCILFTGGHQSDERLAAAGVPCISRLEELPALL